jgi:STE24 endopeptidase
MNAYAAIIAVALVAEYAVDRVADARNLRALREEPPPGFETVYEPDTYRRSQRYTRERTRLGRVSQSVDLAALLAFWGVGGVGWLAGSVSGIAGGPVTQGLVFVAVLGAARGLIDLPFVVYGTFVVEARYGFNRTTVRTLLADMVKGLLLAIVLGGPALAAVIAFFAYGGDLAWVYAWAVLVAFSVALEFVVPTWIMPLFNRFTPLEDGELRAAISAYAASVEFPVRSVMVMDGSRRSTKANAFFTGFGRNKRIALFDTLIAQHGTRELVAVIAHEVGHYKKRHVLQGLVLSVVHTGVLLFLLSQFLTREGLFDAFGVTEPSVYAGLVFFGLLLTPVEAMLSVGLQALSRRHERQADAFAAETTGNPEAMVTALVTLARSTLTNLTPDPFYVLLHYSHPPLVQRVAALAARRSPET